MEKLTISDIARKAGVTESAVAPYFNGGSAKKKTRAIVAQSMTSTVTGRQLTAWIKPGAKPVIR
ncbi:hypothetical protein [Faecalibaculum rodentium]|uniref:hypothetical protein n=1 Tax=Faecalibaculum rodentium TaxID=1702221 RepID=UPI0035186B27